MNPKGGFIGMPGSDKTVGMHILDIYRRDDDKFAENWVFIDMLYFLKQQGLDVLERVQGILSNG